MRAAPAVRLLNITQDYMHVLSSDSRITAAEPGGQGGHKREPTKKRIDKKQHVLLEVWRKRPLKGAFRGHYIHEGPSTTVSHHHPDVYIYNMDYIYIYMYTYMYIHMHIFAGPIGCRAS